MPTAPAKALLVAGTQQHMTCRTEKCSLHASSPKKVSTLNGCFPLLKPCLSRGVGVKFSSPCEHPAPPLEHIKTIFGCSSSVSYVPFVFCLPLYLFLKI